MLELVKPESFVVKRSEWLHGDPASSMLRDQQGKMCCLGFYGLACGIPAADMVGVDSPVRLLINRQISMPGMTGEETIGTPVYTLMLVNDDPDLNNEIHREEHLRGLFQSVNVKLTFED